MVNDLMYGWLMHSSMVYELMYGWLMCSMVNELLHGKSLRSSVVNELRYGQLMCCSMVNVSVLFDYECLLSHVKFTGSTESRPNWWE